VLVGRVAVGGRGGVCLGVGRADVVRVGVAAGVLAGTLTDVLGAGAASGEWVELQPVSSAPTAARTTRRRMRPPSHIRRRAADGYPESPWDLRSTA